MTAFIIIAIYIVGFLVMPILVKKACGEIIANDNSFLITLFITSFFWPVFIFFVLIRYLWDRYINFIFKTRGKN